MSAWYCRVSQQLLPGKRYVLEGQRYLRAEADAIAAAAAAMGVGTPAMRFGVEREERPADL